MIGPSKILTVSYGTFSCTLEGFDDPFSTMRGIAEYFRDLAADDRYFGAEPPTPDAEMLHRIAEREVNKRVETQIDDNAITLRQTSDDVTYSTDADTDETSIAPATATATAPAVEDTASVVVEDPVDIAPLDDPTPVETESVAEKLARIRAVVARDKAGDAQNYVEDIVADDDFSSSSIAAAFADADDQQDEGSDDVVHTAQDDEPDSDDAKEEGAAAFFGDADPASQDFEDDFSQENSVDQDEGDDDPTATPETSAYIANAMGTSSQEVDFEADTEGAVVTEDEVDIDVRAPALARVVKMRREDFEAALHANDLQEIEEEEDALESDAQEVSDIEEYVARDEDDEDVVDTHTEAEFETQDPSTLSPEDEAELMANLEHVRRKADADVRAEKEGRALLENQAIEESAESVSRILDVTNSEMEESEGSRRRSAIAHLKAAVAATRADKFLSKTRAAEDADEMNQYRDDLAKVVRPRRPSEGGPTTSRRMAPLVLVSEQRVDETIVAQAVDGASVTPRRITAGNLALDDDQDANDASDENIFREENTFAEFAQEMGAHELPDLLEAAAAYSSYVEGRAHFSRPQIMKAVADMNVEQEFTREEGLRSFGLLLRRGKIKKIKRGQFTIASTTRFNPEQRAVGE